MHISNIGKFNDIHYFLFEMVVETLEPLNFDTTRLKYNFIVEIEIK